MREFNLSVVQPHLSSAGIPGEAMLFHTERKCHSLFMKEVLQFMLDYPEVIQRTGLTYKDIMDMERPYYLEWRKYFTDTINEERMSENRRQAELASKREHDRLVADLERQKRENASRQRPLMPKTRR
jgi:hypothetical protein